MSFSAEYNKDKVHFLDLEIYRQDHRLCTKTYFNKTDRNGYIPISSGHHPRWLEAIPKSQLIRIKRNCDLEADFELQANTIDRFKQQIKSMNREQLLKPKQKNQ